MPIKSSQLSRIAERQAMIQNDISMLAWKVYSTSGVTDDLYFNDLESDSGIALERSIGIYTPPVGGVGGYFSQLASTSGLSIYDFSSNSSVVRKSLQGNIVSWGSNSSIGVLYRPTQGLYTWAAGRVTIRNRLNATNFIHDGNAVRFQFASGIYPVNIDFVSFGKWKSGTSVGIDGTPLNITFNNGLQSVIIPPSSSVWSDWISFDLKYNVDHVLVVDLADGRIRYAATPSNNGYCMYQVFGTSYYIATPNESTYVGGPPNYNSYTLPTCIEYAEGWKSGHFVINPLDSTASEVEPGCLVGTEDGTATVLSISGNGTSSGSVMLDTELSTRSITGIYGSNYTSGSIAVSNRNGVSPSSYVATKGSSDLRLDTRSPSYWDFINIVIYQGVPGNSEIYHFVSFNSQSSWNVFINSAWRSVARNLNSIWQYNTSSTSTPTWVNATPNDDLSALKSAVSVSSNRMTSSTLNSITESQWVSGGGFILGQTSTMDFAFVMKADGLNVPYVSRYVANYSISTTNVFLISEFWSASAINPKSAYCVICIDAFEEIELNTDIKAFISMDDGFNYDQLTLSLISISGTLYYLRGDNSSLTPRDDNVMRVKIETFNEKDIRVNAFSTGLNYS